MPQQTTLPFFKQKRVITSFNVPRRYQMPVAMLRASCFLPALFYTYQYWKLASLVPLRDAGGPRLIQITQTEYYVAILWSTLAGYWSWVFGTSMMNKWFYQYEFKQAITCLATLNFGICCLSVLFNSHFIDPVRSQLAFCIVLFVCNVLKLVLASSPKYSQKIEDVIPIRFKTPTALNILVLPFIITLAYSVFLLVGQAYRYEYTSDLLMKKGVYNLDTIVAPSTTLILILSSWEGADKRKVMRDTTLNWLKHKNVSYRFIIGQQPSSSYSLDAVKEESEAYNDLLIVPASDLKQDKSHKLYEAFKWSSLAQYDYLIKTDDDVFVRWDIVCDEITEPKDNYWKGFVYRNMPVGYYEKGLELDYGMPILPPFTSGTLYTLSRNLVEIITNVDYPQRFIKNADDTNLALWLFGFDLQPIHDKRIQDEDVCEDTMIAKRLSGYFKIQAKEMYNNLLEKKPQCTGMDSHNSCALCYPCYEKKNDWRSSNRVCDPERGVSLAKLPDYQKIAGPKIKDDLEPAIIGQNDQWIIKDILSARTSIYTDTDKWHLLYWVCWTSEPATFTDRHWRALELVWIHEPEAAIIMMSNSLPEDFFNAYTRRGYNVQVVRFNKENLLNWHWYFGPGTRDWLQEWDRWVDGKFFYWHLTDYIRCLLLYNYGGTYMDMDALWTRIPPNPNQEFIGSDYSQVSSDLEWTLDDKGLYLPQGLMRFKRGWKLFREMAEGAFSAYNYDPKCFNCGGPKAITSYVRERRSVLEAGGLTILPREVLYPINYMDIRNYLQPNPLAEQYLKNKIEPTSWNIHLFGKMTNDHPIQTGSVIDYVFKRFDLDLPHVDTKNKTIISSTGKWKVPMKLVAPADYIYQAISQRMLDADKDNRLALQPLPGKFQGLSVIYIRGGPETIDKITLKITTVIGRVRLNGSIWNKAATMDLEDVTIQKVNSVLNSLDYSPTKLMLANGGRDRMDIQLIYGVEKLESSTTIVVLEPEEEDEPLN
ncbi:galactosyltransferase-domain-containing protein [Sporodiniella umbellata]|nr:galactosyltransferase-domain-containing protein [Sporodiniella umbellata]